MTRVKDLTGKNFGKWAVLSRAGSNKGGKALWLCVCACGHELPIATHDLTSGHSTQCRKCASKTMNYFDGRSSHILHGTYRGMLHRCYREDHINFEDYGGRGIRVCNRWLHEEEGFWNFVEDMGSRPDGYTLDRIDSNGHYVPANCKWSDIPTQNRNKGNAKLSVEEVSQIKKRIASGEKIGLIAKDYKCSRTNLYAIRSGRNGAHIEAAA